MTKARLIYLLVIASIFATLAASMRAHGMSDGGGLFFL